MIKKIKASLSLKVFLITFFILVFISAATYIFVALAMPRTYSVMEDKYLSDELLKLVDKLENVELKDLNDIIHEFERKNSVEIGILDEKGNVIKSIKEDFQEDKVRFIDNTKDEKDRKLADKYISRAIGISAKFANNENKYILMAVGNARTYNQAVDSLVQILPKLIIMILFLSILTANFYSKYIAKSIVEISDISKKMSNLEFNWRCNEDRDDEIGVLAKSLNNLSEKLSTTLFKLQSANEKLKDDIEREKELEKLRLEFFSAVSHEFKTPITVIKGQLSGMIDGVGVYKDRDKYLLHSIKTVEQMEALVQELLFINKIELSSNIENFKEMDLKELIEELLSPYINLFNEKNIKVEKYLEEDMIVNLEPSLIKKVIANLLSNALFYSPEDAKVIIRSEEGENIVLSIENTGVYIEEENIKKIFEPFYRVEQSRNKQTGGTGLGLYFVKTILDKHNAKYNIRNSKDGVMFIIEFSKNN